MHFGENIGDLEEYRTAARDTPLFQKQYQHYTGL